MTSGNGADDLPDHLFRWLEAVGRRVGNELADVLGGDQVVSGRQVRLLQMVPGGGIRASDLAVRARTTKQALGQLVDVLEGRALLVSERDPADARVRRIHRTPAGDAVCTAVDAALSQVEARLEEQVGPHRFATMKQVLRELAGDTW